MKNIIVWLRLIRPAGMAIVASFLVACAHQSVDSGDTISSNETTPENQLQAMVGSAQAEMSSQSIEPADETAGEDLVGEAISTATAAEQADDKAGETVVATTDDLVAQIQPEPFVTAVTGRTVQGQFDLAERSSMEMGLSDAAPLLMAKAVKAKPSKKLDAVVVPDQPSAEPAAIETRSPGSVEYPSSATVVPSGEEPANGESKSPPALMEPNTDDQLKSEVENEKVLASPEVGGVIMRPWFPWVAIFTGCVGFLILGYLKLRKRKATPT